MLGTIQSALVLGRARGAHPGEFLSNPPKPRASAMSGSSMKGRCSFVPFSLITFCVPWTEPLPPSAPPGSALRMATLRVPRACFALLRVSTSSKDVTHDTIDVLAPEAGTMALGLAFGSREHVNARAGESVRACDEMRSATGSVDHAPMEMVLTRQCADVSKLMYHMRINGDLLDKDMLVAFDGQLRASVSASL